MIAGSGERVARRSLAEPRVQRVVERLVALYLRIGSVNAMADALAEAAELAGQETRIHANRLHGLLSADLRRGVNDQTLTVIETALANLDADGPGEPEPPVGGTTRAAILARVAMTQNLDEQQIRTIADQLNVPAAVVMSVAGALPLSAGTVTVDTPVTAPRRSSNWSFQDDAFTRGRTALHRSVGRKVGLVIPTGGGKTRVALRIVLAELHETGPSDDSVVLWITHRKRLATQARRELQRMMTAGTEELPDDAVALLANRVRFVLTTDLQRELDGGRRLLMVVVDEAHHAAAPSYLPIFEARPALPGLFLTATPLRRDGKHIGIDEIAYSITYRQLFERGVLIEPTFDTYVFPTHAWSESEILDEFADYLLDRAEQEFVKTLVVATTVERVLALDAALQRMLAERPDHILSLEDLVWVHGSGTSTGVTPDDMLDEFAAKTRGILVATSSLLSEGFDDRSINAVVITYPSTSLVQLMQVAGRCLRFGEGKQQAFVVQIKDSQLAYHFEQRWLYKEISDVLHPQLIDVEYTSKQDLESEVLRLLDEKRAPFEVRARIAQQLTDVKEGGPCALLLTGRPYSGAVDAFSSQATWNAVLETTANAELVRGIFNEFCDRVAVTTDLPGFLNTYVQQDLTAGSEWRSFINMLLAMQYAYWEIEEQDYEGHASRPYIAKRGTSWLTYVTFTYHPVVPTDVREFLRPCVNADVVLAQYVDEPARWSRIVRVPFPLGGAFAWLLDRGAAEAFDALRTDLASRIRAVAPSDAFSAMSGWLASLPASALPLALLQRIDRFLREDDRTRDVLDIQLENA